MNSYFKTLVLFSLALSHSSAASAHDWCHETYPVTLSRGIVRTLDACQAVPPELVRAPWEDQTVDAWIGGYRRSVLIKTTYRLDHYDRCRGALIRSETRTVFHSRTLSFQISNPNLAPGHPSYVGNAPLTDAEAKAALPELLVKCEAVHPGPWPK